MTLAMTDSFIHEAVSFWFQDPDYARTVLGDISVWDTARVTDLDRLFCAAASCETSYWSEARNFNADLSKWDVSRVVQMQYCKICIYMCVCVLS